MQKIVILSFLQLFCSTTFAQKNNAPLFYNPGFKMPADTPVRTDGFYVIQTIFYDTIPKDNVKKDGYYYNESKSTLIYQFFNNGYFFGRAVDAGKRDIAKRLQHDSDWVRKLYKLQFTDCWGFYKIEKDSVFIERFRYEMHYRQIEKIFDKNYYERTEKHYALKEKMLELQKRNILAPDRSSRSGFIEFPATFVATPYLVDTTHNSLFTDGKFRKTTGFNPGLCIEKTH